jgi:hypothetical protein
MGIASLHPLNRAVMCCRSNKKLGFAGRIVIRRLSRQDGGLRRSLPSVRASRGPMGSIHPTDCFFSPPSARAARGGEGSGVGGASATSLAEEFAERPPTPTLPAASREEGEEKLWRWISQGSAREWGCFGNLIGRRVRGETPHPNPPRRFAGGGGRKALALDLSRERSGVGVLRQPHWQKDSERPPPSTPNPTASRREGRKAHRHRNWRSASSSATSRRSRHGRSLENGRCIGSD